MRDRAIEAVRILNEFVGDLVAGTMGLLHFESQAVVSTLNNKNTSLILRRMCISYLVITLSKWVELFERYKAVFPQDAKQACRGLEREIRRRNIRDFRNTVVGHVWDRNLKRPLSRSEVDARLARTFAGSEQDFLLWINNPNDNSFPKTVVSVCEHTRNRIMESFDLKAVDLFP